MKLILNSAHITIKSFEASKAITTPTNDGVHLVVPPQANFLNTVDAFKQMFVDAITIQSIYKRFIGFNTIKYVFPMFYCQNSPPFSHTIIDQISAGFLYYHGFNVINFDPNTAHFFLMYEPFVFITGKHTCRMPFLMPDKTMNPKCTPFFLPQVKETEPEPNKLKPIPDYLWRF